MTTNRTAAYWKACCETSKSGFGTIASASWVFCPFCGMRLEPLTPASSGEDLDEGTAAASSSEASGAGTAAASSRTVCKVIATTRLACSWTCRDCKKTMPPTVDSHGNRKIVFCKATAPASSGEASGFGTAPASSASASLEEISQVTGVEGLKEIYEKSRRDASSRRIKRMPKKYASSAPASSGEDLEDGRFGTAPASSGNENE